jgi:hypothetical protein
MITMLLTVGKFGTFAGPSTASLSQDVGLYFTEKEKEKKTLYSYWKLAAIISSLLL